ncbi:MAG: CBS domain-containing protein [Coleofasciculaceae cyanobacterium]
MRSAIRSKRDITNCVQGQDYQKAATTNILLAQIMTPNPITVSPDTSLADVLMLLNQKDISRLPVVKNGLLVGIINRTDIIQAETEWLLAENH